MKRFIGRICDRFELGDHEYIKATIGRWPLTIWITVIEPRRRYSRLSKLQPWRVRIQLAGILRKWTYSCCTICSAPITLRELFQRPGNLQYFMSGSICHRTCDSRRAA